MDDQVLNAIITISVVALSRFLSRFEHKKTEKQVTEIHLQMNGYMEERLNAAREEGRVEERNKINNIK